MILINGNFLCRNLTGIERFAWEICNNLDAISTPEDNIAIYIPANAIILPKYKNIRLIQSEKEIHGFPFWDWGTFSAACKKLKATGLNFSNTAPLGKNCGFAFIHDVYAKDHPEDFRTLKDILIKIYCRINYRNIAKNAKKILTVSEFSRNRIQSIYKTDSDRIAVIPNGWDHFKNIKSDLSIFSKFPNLKNNDFYFTLGSLSKRKNLKWIALYAQKHTDKIFVVSGKSISGLVPKELKILQTLENVILPGYVTDGQVKALMENCRAFIFPSYYEGFGIPPLEALSCGARIIVSNSASLPEIYKNTALYIDCNDTDCDLEKILMKKTESPLPLLSEYTYENSALLLKKILKY